MKILISAGPTREKIDPVRFLSNRSSGKMGYALAEAVRDAGHEAILVSGPVTLPLPAMVELIKVESAEEMAQVIKQRAREADVIIMAAAVADYRPVKVHTNKMKKQAGNLILELERTEDILATLGKIKADGQLLVGFAAETDHVIEYAKDKLKRKNLDWIIANDVSASDRGFATENNAVTMISATGRIIELPLDNKYNIARSIIAHLLNY
jgi:phosphopantothenoylcysteine decarboxylase/phosphopantothenate--cysteine ligase